MLYEKYQQRIIKAAGVMKMLNRYRALVISLAAVLIALLTGFLATKGVVYSADAIPKQIVYGESISCNASAFFGSVDFEYATFGTDNWVKEQPKRAGTYQVRAVAKRPFGGRSYSKPQTYSIAPKEIDVTIVSQQIEFGDSPVLSAELEFGDTIDCTRFIYNDPMAYDTIVRPADGAVVITDSSGANVTSSYVLNLAESEISVSDRYITVTVEDQTTVYDGTALSFSGYEVTYGSIPDHHTLVAKFDKYLIDVGSIENTAELIVLDEYQNDVTSRYQINSSFGRLTVEQRTLFIQGESAQKIYDGTPISNAAYSLSSDTPLAAGHDLVLDGAPTQTDVGVRENLLTFRVYDQYGQDVTHNYSFLQSQNSTLEVLARTVEIHTESAEKEYNGTALFNEQYQITSSQGIADGQNLTLVFSGSQTVVGSSKNTAEAYVTDGYSDVSSNYRFEYDRGDLIVTACPIYIETGSETFEYDGYEHANIIVNIVSGKDIPFNHNFHVVSSKTVKNVVSNVPNEAKIQIVDGSGSDVTFCFSITQSTGFLSVSPREITIKTADAEFDYDGTAHRDETHTIIDSTLADGHVSRATGNVSEITDVIRLDSVDNDYGTIENKFEIEIFAGSESVTVNYLIKYLPYGKLKMKPRCIKIETVTADRMYDGTPYSDKRHEVVSEVTLVQGHTSSAIGLLPSITDVIRLDDDKFGGILNEFKIAINEGERDVTFNYDIEYSYGVLTIIPREITVKTRDAFFDYDGEEYSFAEFSVTGDNGIVMGEVPQVLIQTITYIKNVVRLADGSVGTIENVFEVWIARNTENITYNYEISYDYGALTMRPRKIAVTTHSYVFTYDGNSHSYGYFTIQDVPGLVGGQVANADETTLSSIAEVVRNQDNTVGSVENKFSIIIRDGLEVTTYNYDITPTWGTLTMNPLKVSVVSESQNFVYDGTDQFWEGHSIDITLVGTHKTLVEKHATIKDVSSASKRNELSISIRETDSRDSKDVSHNYEIEYPDYGELKMFKRSISVLPSNVEAEYDSKLLTSNAFDYADDTMYQIVDGQRAEVACDGEQEYVGYSSNRITKFEIYAGFEDVTYNYEIEIVAEGTLTVVLRKMTVVTHKKELIYNGLPQFSTDHSCINKADGQTTEVVSYTEITDVGEKENILEVIVHDKNGRDVTWNYDITYINEFLIMHQRKITITTSSIIWDYEDRDYSDDSFQCDNLVGGQEAFGYKFTTVKDAGEYLNEVLIYVQDANLVDQTHNYEIINNFGTLTVNHRIVTVETFDGTWQYDGLEHYNHDYIIEGLLEDKGHYETLTDWTVMLAAGSKENKLTFEISNADGYVTKNYIFKENNGTLSVTTVDISLVTLDYQWVYNGQQRDHRHGFFVEGLMSSDVASAKEYDVIRDVGEKENIISISIRHSSGIDVTDSYVIVSKTFGMLSVSKRNITVKPKEVVHEYDGLAAVATEYECVGEYGVAFGQTAVVEYSGSQTEIGGTKSAIFSFRIYAGTIDSPENEVTDNYEITLQSGTIEVVKRHVWIYSDTKTFEYNGLYQYSKLFWSQNLAFTHEIKVGDDYAMIKDVGEVVPNKLSYEIYDIVTGLPVTDYYIITTLDGTLTVKPMSIMVTTYGAEFDYDAQMHTNKEYTIGKHGALPESFQIVVKEDGYTWVKDVVRFGNEISYHLNKMDFKVYDGEIDVSDNFYFNYQDCGKLYVYPRSVSVVTASEEFHYNGEAQSAARTTQDGTPSLILGHELTIDDASITYMIDVMRLEDHSIDEISNSFKIRITDEFHADVTSNYEIAYTYGKLKMLPYAITVKSHSNQEFIYNGAPQFEEGHDVVPKLVKDTHYTSVVSSAPITSPGTVENIMVVNVLDGGNGSRNISHNYDISYENGWLTMVQAALIVKPLDAKRVYDGKPLRSESYEMLSGQVLPSHFVVDVTYSGEQTVAGVKSSKIESFCIYTDEERLNDITENFDIVYKEGTLEVLAREITITAESAGTVYDGDPLQRNRYSITSELKLPEGHTLDVKISGSQTDAGESPNAIDPDSVTIKTDGIDGIDVTESFIISCINGTLTVNKRPITVTTAKANKVYDAKAFEHSKTHEYAITSEYQPAVLDTHGHTYEIDFLNDPIDVGDYRNDIMFRIMSGKLDVTKNYDVTVNSGMLVITPIIVTYSTGDEEKMFDGTPLTNGKVTVHSGAALVGQTMTIRAVGTITFAGIIDNTIEANVVVNESGHDVTRNYRFVEVHLGVLKITPIGIPSLITGSAEKPYDGTPLTNGYYECDSSTLLAGHEIKIVVIGTITNVGVTENLARITIIDQSGNDMTGGYLIDAVWGILKITGDAAEGDGAGDLDLDGDINKKPNPGEPGKAVTFTAKSDTSGMVYFRAKSFGDYTTEKWKDALPYVSSDINPLMLSMLALKQNGYQAANVLIEMQSAGLTYLMPTYAVDGYGTVLDDTRVDIRYDNLYVIEYYPYTYGSVDRLSLAGTSYESFERAYREYVYRQYTTLPQSTVEGLSEVVNRFKRNSATLVEDVANYVQNKVQYSLNFQDYVGDIALFFFNTAKTGICQHYATAATALYRALGIPARYTIGYAANLSAGKTVDVTPAQAHAWVEIYRDGVGWVQVEVTGGGAGGGDSSEDVVDPNMPKELYVKPVDLLQIGKTEQTLYAKKEIEDAQGFSLQNLLNHGYYYTVEVSGSQTGIGSSESNIALMEDGFPDLIIYDPYGRNVTETFEIKCFPGRLRITHDEVVTVHLNELRKDYDGTPLSYETDDYWLDEYSLPSGVKELRFELSGSLTTAGVLSIQVLEELDYTLLDYSGNDVSNDYSLIFEGELLTVEQRKIEISSASATKYYDGKPLVNKNSWISRGSLPDGHRYEAVIVKEITDIGIVNNTIESVDVYNNQGEDVRYCFEFVYILGKLTILK